MIVKGKDVCLVVYVKEYDAAIVLNKDTSKEDAKLLFDYMADRLDHTSSFCFKVDISSLSEELMIRALITRMKLRKMVFSGGIGFIGENGNHIYPSSWNNLYMWADDVEGCINGSEMCLEYNPDIYFFHRNGYCYITYASEFSGISLEDNFTIRFPEKKYLEDMNRLETDLKQFAHGPFYEVIKQMSPEYAELFVDTFISNNIEYSDYYKSCQWWNKEKINSGRKYFLKKLDEIREILTEDEFKELATIYIQTRMLYLITGVRLSEDGKTTYYLCRHQNQSNCISIVTTDDSLTTNNIDYSKIPNDYLEDIDIYSYSDVGTVNDLIVWTYLEQYSTIEKEYKSLVNEMNKRLGYLGVKPLSWWLTEEIR